MTTVLDKSILLSRDNTSVHEKKVLNVVIGIIKNDRSELLFSYREKPLPQGGYWEFPGGKVNAGESEYDALKREMNEELGIIVHSAAEFTSLVYRHEDFFVRLKCWLIETYHGIPKSNEGQQLLWANTKKIDRSLLTKPNLKILAKIMLRYSKKELKKSD